MTKDELLKIFDLATMQHTDYGYETLRSKVQEIAREALAQTQEPFSPEAISTTQAAWKMGYEAAKAEQEPVVKLKTSNMLLRCHRCGCSDKLNIQIEYTTPPQRTWVGLTDEEIDALHTSIKVRLIGTFDTKDIYRVVEQALKEKNT